VKLLGVAEADQFFFFWGGGGGKKGRVANATTFDKNVGLSQLLADDQ